MPRARDQAGDVGAELAEELLSRGREVTLLARGNSMAPLIRDGDLLVLESLRAAPGAGELVAAIANGRLLVHRVVRADERGAQLQGDALWAPDGLFAHQYLAHQLNGCHDNQTRLIGRVSSARRGDRVLGAWRLGGTRARLWLLALPLVRAVRGALRRVRAAPFASRAGTR